MRLETLIRQAWKSDVFWRYVDVFSPRGFSFVIHTIVIARFGAAAYVLPAWILGMATIVLSLIPEPSGFVLVRRQGQSALRLARLMTPWVMGRALLAAPLLVLMVRFMASPEILAPHQGHIPSIVGASLLFIFAETLWGTCAFFAFATGKLACVARAGLILRTLSVALVISVAFLPGSGISTVLAVYAAPIFFAAFLFMGWSWNFRRVWLAGTKGIISYSLWAYLNGFVVTLLAQIVPLWMGSVDQIPARLTGQIAYATRILNLAVQPLQTLQSVVVRNCARLLRGQGQLQDLTPMRLIFRAGAVCVGLIGILLAILPVFENRAAPGYMPVMAWLTVGLFALTWSRFEFAVLSSAQKTKFLFTHVFLPSIAAIMLSMPVLFVTKSPSVVSALVAGFYIILAILMTVMGHQKIAQMEKTRSDH